MQINTNTMNCLFRTQRIFCLPIIRCFNFFKSRCSVQLVHCSLSSNDTMYLVSRTTTFAKLFFLLSLCGLIMYAVLAFYTFHTAFTNTSKTDRALRNFDYRKRFDNDLKYILLWTIPDLPYNLPADGQRLLIQNNCSYINCYLTTNKNLLNKNVKNFDAIVFSVNTLKNWDANMPRERSKTQKYVFYSMVSAEKNPVCNVKADDFFNWTWTYKTNSDIATPFIEVKDLYGDVVAPRHGIEIATIEDTLELNEKKSGNNGTVLGSTIVGLKSIKSKAVMWFVENCDMKMETVNFAWNLKQELEGHFLELDIYGCEYKKCPEEGCLKMLEKDYFFYLVLEDSVSEDYVTTEVLKAYHHNAVPIVSAGDYSKFLPAGSYIDIQKETIERVAAIILYTIKLPSAYERYFSWKKRFTIHKTNTERGYCGLCAMLNDGKKMNSTSGYKMFRKWWFYGSLRERCIPKGAEQYDEVLSYVKSPGGRRNKP